MGIKGINMPAYVRKTNRQSWSVDSMAEAIEAMMEKRMGYKKAANTYEIPQTTLEARVKKAKKKNHSLVPEIHRVFSPITGEAGVINSQWLRIPYGQSGACFPRKQCFHFAFATTFCESPATSGYIIYSNFNKCLRERDREMDADQSWKTRHHFWRG